MSKFDISVQQCGLWDNIKVIKCCYCPMKLQYKYMYIIFSGSFGVPKDLCGEMYALAVHEFDKEIPLSLKEIHFVDIDLSMLGKIKEGFDNLKMDMSLSPIEKRYPHIVWNEYHREKSYAASVTSGSLDSSRYKNENRKSSSVYGASSVPMATPSPRSNFSPLTRIADEPMASIPITVFQFQNGLKVKIYTGSIVKFHGDAIIVSADENITGFGALGDAVKAAGGFKYEKEFASMQRYAGTRCKAGDIFYCKGGNLTARHVMHIVLKQLSGTRQPQLTEYKQILNRALEKVNALAWRKVAMPLIGAGKAYCFHFNILLKYSQVKKFLIICNLLNCMVNVNSNARFYLY